ncbi:MAG: hypothetical protein H6821_10535 [Planctomycetaceae bacterium]|nr:hypothetical protein [Planctomycetales bacterium]MCB9874603.1 hypothetical protein [Planctomycetaceae bacterium]MCB9938631.1 hypothetical protein [Planctomycetaceae bacterium]HRX80195.1 hypothetical protein [Pirellulaceae bacterium]
MEFNRNHYLGIGMIVLLLGLQFRYVDSFQLTEETTTFLAKRLKKEPTVSQNPLAVIFGQTNPVAMKKTVRPPKWLGWSMISIGSVLVIQSLGMRKSG